MARIYFADKEIPTSPFNIAVDPSIDLSHVTVAGLENRMFFLAYLLIILYIFLTLLVVVTVLLFFNTKVSLLYVLLM